MLKRPSRKQPESLENPEAAIEEGAGTGMTMAVATMTASLRKQESL
jgi:Rad3-related DNA helicase